MKKLLLQLIKAYRYLLSPYIGMHCRFYPSCSCYAESAIEQHGVIRGVWLAMKRLGRCHPWSEGGIDLVPSPTQTHHECDHAPRRS